MRSQRLVELSTISNGSTRPTFCLRKCYYYAGTTGENKRRKRSFQMSSFTPGESANRKSYCHPLLCLKVGIFWLSVVRGAQARQAQATCVSHGTADIGTFLLLPRGTLYPRTAQTRLSWKSAKSTTHLFFLRGAKVEMLTPPKLQIRNGFHPHA